MKTLEEVRENFKNDVYATFTTGISIDYAKPTLPQAVNSR